MSTSYEQKVSDTTINYDTALSSGMSKMNVSTDDVDDGILLTLSCCANCGKEGSDITNTCNKCKSVKYCNAACKKKHRKKHKKKCEERVAELHEEALFKEPPPPDECPICFLILPKEGDTVFQTCCGKIICNGCIYNMVKETRAKGKPGLCPFCRIPSPTSEKEDMKRLIKLVDSGHSQAIYNYACYTRGGNRQDWVKANGLFLKAGELGCAEGYLHLASSYREGKGVEVDKKKAKHYFELAAMGGDICARINLGGIEVENRDAKRAMKHFLIAARAGSKVSLDGVREGFKAGRVTKDEYEEALLAYHKRQNEMKSDVRDKVAGRVTAIGSSSTLS